MSAFFKVFSSLEHGQVNHLLNFFGLEGVEDVTEPLLITLQPVLFVWQVLESRGMLLGKEKEVINGQAFILRHR